MDYRTVTRLAAAVSLVLPALSPKIAGAQPAGITASHHNADELWKSYPAYKADSEVKGAVPPIQVSIPVATLGGCDQAAVNFADKYLNTETHCKDSGGKVLVRIQDYRTAFGPVHSVDLRGVPGLGTSR